MTKPAAARLGVAAAAALWLSSCFTSEEELIGYWAAHRPLPEGAFAHTPLHPDGAEWDRPTWTGTVRLERARYVSDAQNFPHQNARFRRLHDGIYVAQIPREDGVGYGVAFVYEDGAVLSYHQPSCDALSEAARAAADVTLDPEGFCRLGDADQLETVMRAYLEALAGDVRIDGVYRRID